MDIPSGKEANVKDARSGRTAEVWADGYSFREVERFPAEPVDGAASAVPLTEKVLTEARLAACLLGPLLVEIPQG